MTKQRLAQRVELTNVTEGKGTHEGAERRGCATPWPE